MDPNGVHLHRVTNGRHDRSEADPAEISIQPNCHRGPAELPLNAGEWNHCRLSLQGNTVEISINGQLVYSYPLPPANDRIFGVFHYADRTKAEVRNIIWRGEWPKEPFGARVTELFDRNPHQLDERLTELETIEHDFAKDALPTTIFQLIRTQEIGRPQLMTRESRSLRRRVVDGQTRRPG
ncbi:MAG: DUF1583 domain-containing protein [Fuerstiella sp.]